MKAYKGFNEDLTCMGYQYEVGKTYECEDAKVCDHGFHACLRPVDVFVYYAPARSRYCEVEVDEDGLSRREEDSKVAARRITIVREISLRELHEAQLEYAREHEDESKAGGDGSSVAGGDGSSVAGGDRSSVAGGYRSSVTGGDRSSVAGGDRSSVAGGGGSSVAGGDGSSVAGGDWSPVAGGDGSSVAGGDRSSVAGGDGSSVAGGDGSSVAGGDGSSVAGGDESIAASRGAIKVGANAVAACRGNGCKIRGGLGAVLVIAIENRDDYGIASWKAVVVDGEIIKADTWYRLENGELVEAE